MSSRPPRCKWHSDVPVIGSMQNGKSEIAVPECWVDGGDVGSVGHSRKFSLASHNKWVQYFPGDPTDQAVREFSQTFALVIFFIFAFRLFEIIVRDRWIHFFRRRLP